MVRCVSGGTALAGALVLCNSHVWKALPFNVENGKDRCDLSLILFLLFFLSSPRSSLAAAVPHSERQSRSPYLAAQSLSRSEPAASALSLGSPEDTNQPSGMSVCLSEPTHIP